MQVIIYNHQENSVNNYGIGTWLVIGKNDGSTWDRDHFRNSMKKDDFRNKFYLLILRLDDDYFISCNSTISNVRQFSDPDSLADYTHETNFHDYFIIGKAFEPDDKKMSSDSIVQSVITEFTKLYPLFEHTRHRF